jgi:hypothetical protein
MTTGHWKRKRRKTDKRKNHIKGTKSDVHQDEHHRVCKRMLH